VASSGKNSHHTSRLSGKNVVSRRDVRSMRGMGVQKKVAELIS
jgi:hypothetical protein